MNKSIIIVLIVALFCAFALADNWGGGICIPVSFSISHTAETTALIIPGVIDLYAGYQFVINGLTTEAQVAIKNAQVTFTATCFTAGNTFTFTEQIPDASYTVPANSGTIWHPSDAFFDGFQSGPMKSDAHCGTNQAYIINSAVLTGGVLSSETTTPISLRFTYFSFIDLSLYNPSISLPALPGVSLPLVHALGKPGGNHPSTTGGGSSTTGGNNNNGGHWNTGNVRTWFGSEVYSNPPLEITATICLSLSQLQSGQSTYSATVSITQSPSVTTTRSLTNTRSLPPMFMSMPLRKFLKRG